MCLYTQGYRRAKTAKALVIYKRKSNMPRTPQPTLPEPKPCLAMLYILYVFSPNMKWSQTLETVNQVSLTVNTPYIYM